MIIIAGVIIFAAGLAVGGLVGFIAGVVWVAEDGPPWEERWS